MRSTTGTIRIKQPDRKHILLPLPLAPFTSSGGKALRTGNLLSRLLRTRIHSTSSGIRNTTAKSFLARAFLSNSASAFLRKSIFDDLGDAT